MEEDEDKSDPIVYPLDVADGPSRTTIFKTLLMYGATFFGDVMTLHQAVQLDDMEEVEGLLQDESLRINARDNRGMDGNTLRCGSWQYGDGKGISHEKS